nr:cyanobactin biosynthesis PatC/TenC/TruC family protein [Dolichospermum sp. UHCC 0259]
MKSISLNASWAIGTLQVKYENLSSTPSETYNSERFGSGGGDIVTFSIEPGNYLTKINAAWGRQAPDHPKEEIITIQFETKNGVKSQVFGGASGKAEVESFVLEAPKGQEIIGFFGDHGGRQDLFLRLGIYCQPITAQTTLELAQPETSKNLQSVLQKAKPQELKQKLLTTGLADYGFWSQEMAKQKAQQTEPDKPFRRGRIWC